MSRPALKAILRALHEAPGGLTGAERHAAARLNPRGRYANSVLSLQLSQLVVYCGGRYFVPAEAREDVASLLGMEQTP